MSRGWWGSFQVPEDHGGHWGIGPFDMWVRRRLHEWRVASAFAADEERPLVVECPIGLEELPQVEHVERYASRRTSAGLRVTPRLADRPVVTRPEVPFHLVGGDEIALYVSSPVWVALAVGEPERNLFDIPTQRPPDTWFGPSTMVGELAYASRTAARLHLENLPRRAHRAITRVVLRNQGRDGMLLERLNLPLPTLALWASDDGTLWTDEVAVTREPDGHLARFEVAEGPPAEAAAHERVAQPRLSGTRGGLVRALGALMG